MFPTHWHGIGLIAQVATLLYVFAFLTRDELKLRLLAATASLLLVVFNLLVAGGPRWMPLSHSALIGAINVVLLGFIVRERSTFGMRGEMREIYRVFPTLRPGQFRRLMRVGTIRTFETETRLCTEGERPERLYLVLGGEVLVRREGRSFAVGPGNFIGEISFLLDGPATATADATAGARCLVWRWADLAALTTRSPGIGNGLTALLNRDLARKLSISAPSVATTV